MQNLVRTSRAARLAKLVVDIVWWLVITGLIAGVVMLTVYPIVTGDRPQPIEPVQVTLESKATQPLLAQFKQPTSASDVRVVNVDEVKARLDVFAYKWWIILLAELFELPALAALLAGLLLLRRFLRDVLADSVFTLANAQRLSRLGWLLVIAGVGLPVFEYARSLFLLKLATTDLALIPARLGIVSQGLLFPGLLVLVLAVAWRRGAELQTENDLTV